tara:strand:+ start:3514 stop:4140 length:627 start_codon:yes stop_codon:yes gene_type:complete
MPIIENIAEDNYIDDEKLELIGSALNKSIPGQSLVKDPEQPYPWEGPPKYTTVPDASLAIFVEMTKEETFVPLIQALKQGFPVTDMANLILYRGFQTGQFSPDLMLLLLEPVIYMILALAEKAGIGDVVGYDGEEDDDEGEPEEQIDALRRMKQSLQLAGKNVSEQSVADLPELKQEILEFEVPENLPSLLGRSEQPTENNSLLDRGT